MSIVADNFNLLLEAIKNNNKTVIDKILSLDENNDYLNRKDYGGNDILKSALLYSAKLDVVEKLVVAGASPSLSNSGMLIHTAIDNDINLGIIKYLIENGMSLDVKDNYGNRAIFKAITKKDISLLHLLLELGVGLNFKSVVGSNALSMLFKLPEKVCIEMMKLLLSHGATPDVKDEYGVHVISAAARHSNPDIIKLLINYNPNPNVKDNYGVDVVNLVVKSSYFKVATKIGIIKGLHGIGANLDQKDSYGEASIFAAIKQQQYDVVSCLLSLGANPNMSDVYGNSILLKLITSDVGLSKHKELINLSIQSGANPNAKDSYGEPSLAVAIKRKDIHSVRKLLEYGADANAKNIYGNPLIFQVLDNKEMFKEFLKHNISLSAKNSYGESLLSKIKTLSKEMQALYESPKNNTTTSNFQLEQPLVKKKVKSKIKLEKEVIDSIEIEKVVDYKEKFKNHLKPSLNTPFKNKK